MDSFEIAAWTVLLLLLVVPAVIRVPVLRRAAARLLERLGERLTAEGEPDPEEVELYQALRRERLVRDVARLRGILARDETMSAVRQIGNRMAYDRLLLDLRELPEALSAAARAMSFPSGSTPWLSTPPGSLRPGPVRPYGAEPVRVAGEHRPNVEVLELGWGR